ncbi:tetratricopeptide repeat protein [Stenotrophomonas acidaminiphila]|uniref:SirB1 family protein n=1 Tax=Stenotrophomonas TaxID=40323 RepID=UPI0013527A0E|nr:MULTISPECIES: SirB1 family protein [Stenotrophomonas]MCH1908620.1 SirB1 family protein [Stenotrophomonas sp. Y6]MPS36505.1 tetratricopeptide repeat protein [Stenotrophomonas sp.]MTI74011.1 tetratricopeptide repeat protein [Stenotrophomonas sp.]NCT88420.1 tetratricopeptide repeat protein [Stenotrophomonas acidaminiphila]WPU55294.1 SirB1 family protein [Stenotrophomonas acidaminiphila]
MSDTRLTLPQWDALADLADDALPLLPTALLIARDEYPQLDPGRYDRLLQAHADHLRVEVAAIAEWPLKVAAINHHLFNELGYSGNHDAYYDPRNSYLNEVVTRRLGNPISLALVQMEVCRRLGLPLEGISFPGHFLVRLPVEEGVLVMDPFNGGRPLGVDELRERARNNLGGEAPDDQVLAQILDPAPARAILMRMLRNLYGVYAEREEWDRAARSADRILKLAPEQSEALRDRGLAYLRLDHRAGARADLSLYLRREPDAADAAQVREQLIDLGGERPQLH